jgi:hypothetical protein
MNMEKSKEWKTLKSEYLIKRPWLTARRDTVELPTGVTNDEYYVLEYPDWINVIAITEDGQMVFVRQYRYALGITSFEIVAGVIEKGEEPLEAARRELQGRDGVCRWRLATDDGAITQSKYQHQSLLLLSGHKCEKGKRTASG